MAQKKYPVLNYLPVVKLGDWLRRDGLDILVENEKSEQEGILKRILRQAKIAESLPLSVPLPKIAEVHFPRKQGNKADKQASEKFHEHVGLIEEFGAIEKSAAAEDLFRWFQRNRRGKIEEIIRRLSRHAVLGHYFLETLSHDEGPCSGYVCLLREVNTLSRLVAEELGKGLDAARYEALHCEGAQNMTALSIPADGLAMPITEVGSPTLEHILQSFSHLFGRIGVADPDNAVVDSIVNLNLDGQ